MKLSSLTKGFSLVELLVSMAIAAIILAGMSAVIVSSRGMFQSEQEQSGLQESIRYVTQTLAYDIRNTGSAGCSGLAGNAAVVNVLQSSNGAPDPDANTCPTQGLQPWITTHSIYGVEASGGSASIPAVIEASEDDGDKLYDSAWQGGDVLIVGYADPSTSETVTAHTSGTFTLASASALESGGAVAAVAANCRNMALFAANNVSGTSLTHGSVGGNADSANLSNCVQQLFPQKDVPGSIVTCNDCESANSCPDLVAKGFPIGSQLMRYVSHAYYVAESSIVPGVPALKRRSLTASGGSRVEELALGVENFEVMYGLDTDDDNEVDSFQNAACNLDWSQVVAVRYSIIFRSETEVLPEAVPYKFGANFSDRYQRLMARGTIALRNRT